MVGDTGCAEDSQKLASRGGETWLTSDLKSVAVMLDPVYTGKCFTGLLDQVEKGSIPRDQTVVFLHSGSAPNLFAQASAFSRARNISQSKEDERWQDRD